MAVADAGDTVLAPAVGGGGSLLVGEVCPGGAVGSVVFADGAPLAFGKIRAPALPVFLAGAIIFEANVFGSLQSGHEDLGYMCCANKHPREGTGRNRAEARPNIGYFETEQGDTV